MLQIQLKSAFVAANISVAVGMVVVGIWLMGCQWVGAMTIGADVLRGCVSELVVSAGGHASHAAEATVERGL